jgi:hypothetical protein
MLLSQGAQRAIEMRREAREQDAGKADPVTARADAASVSGR